MNKMHLVFATNNENKIREIRNILGSSLELSGLNDFQIENDIPENEPTLEGNALHKARYINSILKRDVFIERPSGCPFCPLCGREKGFRCKY
jgi:XTP/dITP diphosphohydrolase